jgi:hypothetical protein
VLNDSLYLNPAYGALAPSNHLAFNWVRYSTDATTGPGSTTGRNYSVAVQDGSSEVAQAGVAYTVRQDSAWVHLGVAKAAMQRLGFGIAGKYMIDSRDGSKNADAVFSLAAIPLDWLQLALVVDNLFENNHAKRFGNRREIILGTKFNVKGIFLAYADPQWTPGLTEQFGYSVGLEFPLMKDLFLRWGRFDGVNIPYLARRGEGYGLGLGWLAPKISFDYGLSRVLAPVVATAHTLGATVYF